MLQSYHMWTAHFIGHSKTTALARIKFFSTPLHQHGRLIEVNEETVFFDAALFDGLYGGLIYWLNDRLSDWLGDQLFV